MSAEEFKRGRVQKIVHIVEGQKLVGVPITKSGSGVYYIIAGRSLARIVPARLNIKGHSPQFDIVGVHSVPGSLAKSKHGYESPFMGSSLLIYKVRTLY